MFKLAVLEYLVNILYIVDVQVSERDFVNFVLCSTFIDKNGITAWLLPGLTEAMLLLCSVTSRSVIMFFCDSERSDNRTE